MTRTKTVSELAAHLGCTGYLSSFAVRDYRASVLDGGEGVYWLAIEDRSGITNFTAQPNALAALKALSLFIESKQKDN